MTQTDAQRRAALKYTKANVKSFNVKFYPGDEDIYEWLQAVELKNAYIKALIRADMERTAGRTS